MFEKICGTKTLIKKRKKIKKKNNSPPGSLKLGYPLDSPLPLTTLLAAPLPHPSPSPSRTPLPACALSATTPPSLSTLLPLSPSRRGRATISRAALRCLLRRRSHSP